MELILLWMDQNATVYFYNKMNFNCRLDLEKNKVMVLRIFVSIWRLFAVLKRATTWSWQNNQPTSQSDSLTSCCWRPLANIYLSRNKRIIKLKKFIDILSIRCDTDIYGYNALGRRVLRHQLYWDRWPKRFSDSILLMLKLII